MNKFLEIIFEPDYFSAMQKHDVPQFFTCLEFTPNGDIITGDSSGGIIVWSKGSKPGISAFMAVTLIQSQI